MSAQRYDFVIEQGGTFSLTFLLSLDGVIFPLNDYECRMQARVTPESDALFSLDSDVLGGMVITPGDGKIEVTIESEDTTALDFNVASYGVEIYMVDGEGVDTYVNRVLEGFITLSKDKVF